jgi:hypothetical protein
VIISPIALYDYCRPTFVSEWPATLLAFSFDTHFVHLSGPEFKALQQGPLWRGPVWGYADPVVGGLIEKMEAPFKALGGSAFVRTQVRSPKDGRLFQRHRGSIGSPWLALVALQESERVQRDCEWLQRNRSLPVLVLRRWAEIRPWAEFRCLIREGRVVGITHLRHQAPLPDAVRCHAPALRQRLLDFCSTWVPVLPRPSVVADVVIPEWTGDGWPGADMPKMVLSELNPWHSITDAGWFDWRNPAGFDGSLRCN